MDVGILYETATSPHKQFYPGEDTSQRLSGPLTAVHLPHVCRPGECVSRLAGGPSLHKTSFLLIDGIAAGANTRGPHRFFFFCERTCGNRCMCVCELARRGCLPSEPADSCFSLPSEQTSARDGRRNGDGGGKREALTFSLRRGVAPCPQNWLGEGRPEGRR